MVPNFYGPLALVYEVEAKNYGTLSLKNKVEIKIYGIEALIYETETKNNESLAPGNRIFF
jgi:hypothetical protein